MDKNRKVGLRLSCACIWLGVASVLAAAPPEQEAYWWQDEIRETVLAHAATSGKPIPQWPNMALKTEPLSITIHKTAGAPKLDSALDDPVWQAARSLSIGPVFDRWVDGPFSYDFLAVQVDDRVLLAIRSPRDLRTLGALSPERELFRAGNRAFRAADASSESKFDGDYCYLWAIPNPRGEPLGLAFTAETLRYEKGELPPGCEAIGLDQIAGGDGGRRSRTSPLWLAPYHVTLTPTEESFGDDAPKRLGIASWKPMNATERADYCKSREDRARKALAALDKPLLFVKREPYFAGHIYDDYYTWRPGGGIYVLENPQEAALLPVAERRVRAVIDPTTNETLGEGVYRDPAIGWDADRLLFAFRPGPDATTSLYEIGLDGRGLRRLTASEKFHDITPDYLPDGRIVFNSTRPKALVPCFNSGVDTLHTMRPDGSDIRSISANNVNEFDPTCLPDGRILYGRWEYVDKTALYMQSIWTMLPDGSMEEAVFGNNMAKPTAILDARPVPGSHRIVASLTPHNGQAVGAIAMIDPRMGKNDLAAIENFTPEYPAEMDQGLHIGPSDPWPLSDDRVLITNNALGGHGIVELVNDCNERELVHCDAEISLFAPMLARPRPRPTIAADHGAPSAKTGAFLLTDVYQGLDGVQRGEAKRLRIVEETARTSGLPPGGRWWNQAFLVSWQGAYIVKNILGTVPIHEDGSAHFEVPSGRALYFEVLDDNGCEIQRMRSFVNAAPGATRSCIGCHENKKTTPVDPGDIPVAARLRAVRPSPESWGSGYIDYPTMIQPILDDHCVRCHGGEQGMAGGIDFSGGWTWAFNISYEAMIKHRLTGFLNCHNASVHTSELIPPRTIGSGGSRLAEMMRKDGHGMSRAERDLLFAWMDTNSNYFGTWDYTPHATCDAILETKRPLSTLMNEAGCTECHAAGHIGNDWVNLQTPERSRILRAPMARSEGGLGLEFCRKRAARAGYPLIDQRVQPPDVFLPTRQPEWDPSGETHVSFQSTDDPHYQAMLGVIRMARAEALMTPRIDMPGSVPVAGQCRIQFDMPVPLTAPPLAASIRADGLVELSWPRTADTIGLQSILHRGDREGFAPSPDTQIGLTTAGRFVDFDAPIGTEAHYAIVLSSGERESRPVWASIDIPELPLPTPPVGLTAHKTPGAIRLTWTPADHGLVGYYVERARISGDNASFVRMTKEPSQGPSYIDWTVDPETSYAYRAIAVDRFGRESGPSTIEAQTLPLIETPVFETDFASGASGTLFEGEAVKGRLHSGARVDSGMLRLGETGHATYPHRPELDIRGAISVELRVRLARESRMPVVAACGAYNGQGWFLQRFGGGWRWHLAPLSCDGGRPVVGEWVHLVGTYDGQTARLYQDGELVAEAGGACNTQPWSGPLVLGQYSSASPDYQVHGELTGFKVYRRVLRPDEVKQRFEQGP